jgi:hypothetical protein
MSDVGSIVLSLAVVSHAISVGISLRGIGDVRAIVGRIWNTVTIAVGIARVAKSVFIQISLCGVERQGAIVARIADRVPVAIR